ncbi:MAG: CvpA family protein [Sphingomonadaceae bacterium]
MTALDIITLLLVGGGLVFGFLRGLAHEVLALAAWIGAVVALKLFHDPVAERLVDPVGTVAGAAVLAFALVFGLVFFGGKLVARRVGSAARSSVVGPFDRVLGAGFGALKGLIGATLLFLLATLVLDTLAGGPDRRPEWMTASATYPLLSTSGEAIVDFVEARRAADGDGMDEEPRAESRA